MTSLTNYIIKLSLILVTLFFIPFIAQSQQNLIGTWEDKKFKGEFIHFKNDSTMIMKGRNTPSIQFSYIINYNSKPASIILKPRINKNTFPNPFSSNELKGIIEFISSDEIYLEIQLLDENMFGENSKTKSFYIRSDKK